MAIDSSIYNNIRVPEQQDPIRQYAQLAQLQGAQSQNRLAQLALGQQERQMAGEQALNDAYKGALGADGVTDRNKLYSSIVGAGQGSKLPGIQKGFAEQDKSTREAEKAKLELAREKLGLGAQLLGGVRDQMSYDQARQAMQAQGLDVSTMPAQFNPAVVSASVQKALTAAQQVEQVWKQKGYDLDVSKFGESQRHNRAAEGLTARGQNMADARSREANKAAALSQPFTVAGPDGKDILVQQNKATGGLIPVQGGFGPKMSDKAPTEFQGKSATYGMRADEADKILTELTGKYSPAAVNTKGALGNVWGVGGALEAGANVALSKEAQKAEQAMRNFVNAVLRQESGAAISEGEFNNAKKQYFPQPGDGADVIAQKAANRKTAIAGFKANAGKAAASTGGATGDFGPKPANIDALLDKYK